MLGLAPARGWRPYYSWMRPWNLKLAISLFYLMFSKNLARLLFQAATDGGYVDPSKIEEILGVSSRSLNNTPSEEGNVETKGRLRTSQTF